MNDAMEELVHRAVRNACPPVGVSKKLRWSCVADLFCVGSTMAFGLCIGAGTDPDELLEGGLCKCCPLEDE